MLTVAVELILLQPGIILILAMETVLFLLSTVLTLPM